MSNSDQTYHFPAPILRRDDWMRMHYAPIPTDIADELEAAGVRRVIVTVNGRTLRRAIQRTGEGERHVLLGMPFLREAGVREGDVAPVELYPDPDPDYIELGEEFSEVLEMDEEAAARFFAMTPGRQRSLAYYVTSAKRQETRIKRALELAHKLRTHTLYGDQREE